MFVQSNTFRFMGGGDEHRSPYPLDNIVAFCVCLFHFLASCRHHTMKCYISNKWHGRLERSLDDILSPYKAPQRESGSSSRCGSRIYSFWFSVVYRNCFCPFFNLCWITACVFALDVFDCLCPFYHYFHLSSVRQASSSTFYDMYDFLSRVGWVQAMFTFSLFATLLVHLILII